MGDARMRMTANEVFVTPRGALTRLDRKMMTLNRNRPVRSVVGNDP